MKITGSVGLTVIGLASSVCVSQVWAVTSACSLRTWSDSQNQQMRTAWVCVPDVRPTPTSKAPMLLAFHGRTTTPDPAAYFKDYRRLHACWPEAVVVYFNAYNNPDIADSVEVKTWQLSRYQVESVKNPSTGVTSRVQDKDITFVDSFTRQLATEWNVDTRRIYGTGFSAGSYFLGLLWYAGSDSLGRAPFRALAFVGAQPDLDMINGSFVVPVHMATSPYDVSVRYDTKQKPAIEAMRSRLGIVTSHPLPAQMAVVEGQPPMPEEVYVERGGAAVDLQVHLHAQGHAWPLDSQPGRACGRESVLVTDFLKAH